MSSRSLRTLVASALLVLSSSPRGRTRAARDDGDGGRETHLRALRDERGRIDVASLLRARSDLAAAARLPAALRSPGARGPWTSRGAAGFAGRARSLVFHPTRPGVMWLATGSGGVWKTEDGGTSWRPLTDHLGLPSGCLVMDRRDPDHLWWGTGERYHSGGPGLGIWETRDGGETWTSMEATRSWTYVNAISVSPTDPNLMLASTAQNFRYTGLYRSTDAGASWTKVLSKYSDAFDAQFDPGDPTRALAIAQDDLTDDVLSFYSVYRSTDSGATWTIVPSSTTSDVRRYALAFAPSDPRVVYVAAAGSISGTQTVLFRSTDGGETFERRAGPLANGTVRYATSVWVSPTDANVVLLGGVYLFRSTDGGATFGRLVYEKSDGTAGHADHQEVVAAPGFDGAANRRVYVLNDGGLDVIDDVLAPAAAPGAVRGLDANLRTHELWAMGVAGGGRVLEALQDNGIVRLDAAAGTGTHVELGDGACALLDRDDARYAYACSQGLTPYRLDPDGHVEDLSWTLPDSIGYMYLSDEVRSNFIAPVILDPGDPRRMLAGGRSLWRSENVRDARRPDRLAVWTEIKPKLTTPARQPGDNLIDAIAVAPSDSNVVFVGYNLGQLYVSRDALSSSPRWETLDDNVSKDPLPNRLLLKILVDRTNTSRVLLAFGGVTSGNVMRTTDGGQTWAVATGRPGAAIPDVPVWTLAQHPERADTFYAGTEVGVFETEDGGASWFPVSASAFTVAVHELAFFPGTTTLAAGTFGRGVWTFETAKGPCFCRRGPGA